IKNCFRIPSMGKTLVILLVAAMLFSSGCETSNPKPSKVAPNPGAMAPTIAQATAKPEAPKIEEKIVVPKGDPVEALIKQVEQEYQAGQANYGSGHLEAAKANFDRAVNMLMQGPVEVRSDERLQRE